jgi:hypothetical protein
VLTYSGRTLCIFKCRYDSVTHLSHQIHLWRGFSKVEDTVADQGQLKKKALLTKRLTVLSHDHPCMALHIFSTIISTIPSSYYFPAVVTILLLAITRAYTQGRRTNRDRNLHARTVIVTVSHSLLRHEALRLRSALA